MLFKAKKRPKAYKIRYHVLWYCFLDKKIYQNSLRCWLRGGGVGGKGVGLWPHREGMGLLEYQAMASLRDVAHDGVLCTISNRSAPDRGQVVWSVRAGGMNPPSRTKSHLSGWHSSIQPGGPPCCDSPLAFGITACDSEDSSRVVSSGFLCVCFIQIAI